MEETTDVRYWCHLCSQVINPVLEIEIKCPFCQTGFVEEMRSTTTTTTTTTTSDSHSHDPDPDFGFDRAFSRWAPVLINMMENPRRRFRRRRRLGIDDDFDLNDEVERRGIETQMDDELESIITRRRRSSSAILQLLQGIRSEMVSEGNNNLQGPNNQNLDREREQVILINPFNQTIVVRGSSNSSNGNQNPIGSLGDYLVGPGLDLLLQHLSENDPNRHGTPPASKEAIELMPIVKVHQHLNCSVCLDDFEIGAEAKEMPCKHKFHNGCILPWLELHSSCPVCRFQLPHDESKPDGNENENNSTGSSSNDDGEEARNTGAGRRFFIPWPFNGFFSSSSSSSSSAGGNSSQTDEV